MLGVFETITGQTVLSDKLIEDKVRDIRNILIDADVNLQVVNALLTAVKGRFSEFIGKGGEKSQEMFVAVLYEELVKILGAKEERLLKLDAPASLRIGSPNIIVLFGLQGAGKTTAAGKLAKWIQNNEYGKKVLMIAADVYRPAAVDQLVTLGQRISVDVYHEGTENSPTQITRNGLDKARAEGYDTVIIDTAGRQVVDDRLMEELKQIKKIANPVESLLVVDAMTGQEAATLTARFNDEVGITGAILTKLDGDTRGGSALSIRTISGKPIKFIGVGEQLEDLELFYPRRMASRIMGLGDLETLGEKFSKAMTEIQAAEIIQRLMAGEFRLSDYYFLFSSIRATGGLNKMVGMMPGMSGMVSEENMFEAQRKMLLSEKIFNALTEEEKENPEDLCNYTGSKETLEKYERLRAEIAKRAGVTVTEVNEFIGGFTMMRKNMGKMFGKFMKQKGNGLLEKADKKKDIKQSTAGGGKGFGKKN
eukprot:gene12040-13154_t